MDAQEACVLVAVVVGGRVVHPVVPVGHGETLGRWRHGSMPHQLGLWPWGQQGGRHHPPVEHVEVEPGEHALAGPAGREGAAATHHHVQHSEGNEVCLLQGQDSLAKGPSQGWGCTVGTRGTYQEGAALQPYHDVSELRERSRAQADLGHVSF